ncbi:putative phage abortive infection protein [Lactococcus petauri]|uniref:putative phage abortive infection protein n=1 Tax=Lactococcus petauri TaxID=1940789 RepID=UPI00254F0488|nr:putative phage abortive infection protein [Lactococcus petauri]
MNIILFDKALTRSDWLNFWGNIIGAMLGVFGTFLVMFLQLKREREKNSKEKIDTTFFNLLTLFQNVKSEFDTYRFIKAIESEISVCKNSKRLAYYTDELSKRREQFIKDINEFDKLTNYHYKMSCSYIKDVLNKDFDVKGYRTHIKRLQSIVEKTHEEYFFKYTREMDDLYREYEDKKLGFKYEVTEIDIPNILEEVSLMTDNNSGNYFRALYRCLKYIMVAELTMDEKKFYSGVLRGILSSDEMLAVFYNCIYYERGEKFKELLEKSQNDKRIDFFGDKKDLENLNKGYDLPFFSKKNFLFPEYDMDI